MAQEDLIPMNERTKEEQKKIATMGGIASGEARRKKKTMEEQAKLLLSLAVKNPKLKKVMNELGLEEDEQTNQMAMIISVMNKAITKGDVSAFNTLQATIGEKPAEKIEVSKTTDETILEVEKYLNSKKEVDVNE
jgi:hypothetical protein